MMPIGGKKYISYLSQAHIHIHIIYTNTTVLCLRVSKTGVASPDESLGEDYGDPRVPSRKDPLLCLA